MSVVKKHERVNEYLKDVRSMVDGGIRPGTSGFRKAVTPDTYFSQDTKDSAEIYSLRVIGIFRTSKKNPDY